MTTTSRVTAARGSAPRAAPSRPVALTAAVALVAAAAGVGAWWAVRAHAAPHYTYGRLPSWLPKSTVATSAVLRASPTHPAMAIVGETVRVTVASGVTVASVTGPVVAPGTDPVTSATLTLTLRQVSGTLTARATDLGLVDGHGVVQQPQAFVGGARSATLQAGQSRSLRVTAFMAAGSGALRWAPGGHPVATWEFTIEND